MNSVAPINVQDAWNRLHEAYDTETEYTYDAISTPRMMIVPANAAVAGDYRAVAVAHIGTPGNDLTTNDVVVSDDVIAIVQCR